MRGAALCVVMLAASVTSCHDAAGPPIPASIEFDVASEVTMPLGAWDTVTAIVRDAAGRELPRFPVTWSSENLDIVLVSDEGLLIADAEGSALITASAGSITASFRVRVVRTLAALEVTPTDTTLQIYSRLLIQMRLFDGKGEEFAPMPVNAAYATSDSGVLVVDDTGAVHAVGWGTAVITVEVDGVAGAATLSSVPREFNVGDAQLVRIDVGLSHRCGLDAVGAAYCSGANLNGETGYPLGIGDTTTFLPVPTTLRFSQLGAGENMTCGLTATGEIWCWGFDRYASFGLGWRSLARGPTPIRVDSDLEWQHLEVGDHQTVCAIPGSATPVSGVVHCWGHNDFGQVGRLPRSPYDSIIAPITGEFVGAQVSVGRFSACGVSPDRAAFCWGVISHNESGLPTAVSGAPPLESVTVSINSACGLTAEGEAMCWVAQSVPEPVAGDLRFSTLAKAAAKACGITTAGRLYCWGFLIPLPDAAAQPPISFGWPEHTFIDVAAGLSGICAITTQHRVFCW